MITDNLDLLNAFSKHFNTRLVAGDFTDNTHELLDILNHKNTKGFSGIILPCGEEQPYQQLIDFRYPELLKGLALSITIDKALQDIYLSEFDVNLLMAYQSYIDASKKYLKITCEHETKVFHIAAPDLFVNITIAAFSQLHTEVTAQLDYLNRLIAISSLTTGNSYTDNLFINSKPPTPYSSFILAYLAENLNIKLSL